MAAIVVATLWRSMPHRSLLVWLGAVLLLTLLRARFHARYLREQPADAELGAWGRRFVLSSVCSGSLWGSAGVLFFTSQNGLSQWLLTFAVGGMVAAAAGTLTCHLPAFYGFCTCAFLPLIGRALLEGDRAHLAMGALLSVYALGMHAVARRNHEAFTRAFGFALENAGLLERLSLSQLELTEANRTLEQRVLERTRALEEQTHALRQAQRLELLGRLAGGLAHDFNNLLTVVINNSKSLKELSALDEQAKLAADETLEAAQRGAALIRHLLAFSRKKRAEPRVFALRDLLAEWTPLLARVLGHGAQIAFEPSTATTQVYADPAQVEHVLVNLVARARAAVRGSGRLRLATRLGPASDSSAAGDYVQLVLEYSAALRRDGDEPIAPDPYEMFAADSRGSRSGLSAIWSTAEQWGGRVLLEAEDAGSGRFVVLFPPASSGSMLRAVGFRESSAPPRSATLLLVDDEPTLRSVMRRGLVREGYRVLLAEDGARALALAKAYPGAIDLLVTDVVMPGMSGLELSRQLRRERPGARVLFISGFTFEESVPETDLAAGTSYLPKPFDIQTLAAKVRELLLEPGPDVSAVAGE